MFSEESLDKSAPPSSCLIDFQLLDLIEKLARASAVTHHDMHHEKSNGNYGFYFTFWDRLMGTEHTHYLQRVDQATNIGSEPGALQGG